MPKSSFRRYGTQPPATMNGVKARGLLPLDELEREETFGKLRELMNELSPPDREILTLRYALDYNAGAIADVSSNQRQRRAHAAEPARDNGWRTN